MTASRSSSGIIAVVLASFSVTANTTFDPKHQYPGAFRTRLQEDQVWPVVDFLLETFVFAYIGLQLKFVLEDLAASEETSLGATLIAAGVLLVAAIMLRMVGVFTLFGRRQLKARMRRNQLERHPELKERIEGRDKRRRRRRGQPLDPPTVKGTLLVSWIGMRGILTLAAAAAVPEFTASGEPFPGRDAIQAIALLGTLLIQGTTIGMLTRALRFDTTGERSEAVHERRLDEETARRLIEEVDLRQAAQHTTR